MIEALAGHVILGVLFSCAWIATEGRIPFVLDEILFVPHFAFVFSQTSLLALWAAFSKQKWWRRLTGWAIGTIYLEALLAIGWKWIGVTLLATAASSISLAILLALRWWNLDLRQASDKHLPSRRTVPQFSIRGMMLLTLVIAVLTVALKGAWEMLNNVSLLLFMVGVSLSCAAVGIAASLAALGHRHPLTRSIASMLFALSLGALLASTTRSSDWEAFFYFCTTMLLQTALVLGSSVVLRSCGFRLISRSASSAHSAIRPTSNGPSNGLDGSD